MSNLANDRPCKICSKKRYANTSWCWNCYRKREKEKKEAKLLKIKARKESTKKFKEDLRKKTHRRVWKLMSEYIRRRNANEDGYNECFTCGKWEHWKKLHCGHYKHDKLDFDERNLNPQCNKCNTYLAGKLDVYSEKLTNIYGVAWVNDLVADAWTHKGYSVQEMLEIEKDLKNKLSKL